MSNWVMRFPLIIYSLDFSKKHIFTEGNVSILHNTQKPDEDRWKYFVLTKNDGSRVYCTSQLLYVAKY
jgi:hypothetical protein